VLNIGSTFEGEGRKAQKPIYQAADERERWRISHAHGATVHYGPTPACGEGTLTVGENIVLEAGKYFTCTGRDETAALAASHFDDLTGVDLATQRELDARAPLADIREFGVYPDREVDSTTSLNRAFEQSITAGVGLTGPAGDYNISQLVLRSGLRLGGDSRMTFKQIPGVETSQFAPPFDGSTQTDIRLRNITIDGQRELNNAISTGNTGISAYFLEDWTLEGVWAFNTRGYGFGFQGFPGATEGNKGAGVVSQKNLTMVRCRAINCGNGRIANASSVLSKALNSSETTLEVDDTSVFDPSGGTLELASGEIVHHAEPSTPSGKGTFSIIRGCVGTTAAEQAKGSTVYRSANGDGCDIKYIDGLWIDDWYAAYCGDKGLNPRGICSIRHARAYKCVTGFDFNANRATPATSVTGLLKSEMTAAATPTSVILTSPSSSIPTSGTGHIGGEQVIWTGKETVETSNTKLTGFARAQNGCYAEKHLVEAKLVWEDSTAKLDSDFTLHDLESVECNLGAGSMTASGGSSVTRVVADQLRARSCYSGFVVRGGDGRIRAQIGAVEVHDSKSSEGQALLIEGAEKFQLDSISGDGNVGKGLWIKDQGQGGTVDKCSIRGSTFGIVEQGATDHVDYGAGCKPRGNTTNVSLVGGSSYLTRRTASFNGTENIREFVATVTWDPPEVEAGKSTTSEALTATGAATGQAVSVSSPSGLPAGCFVFAVITASNAVKLTLLNLSSEKQNVASTSFSLFFQARQSMSTL
jgi:hypothetical protein